MSPGFPGDAARVQHWFNVLDNARKKVEKSGAR
jgi:hypothetical protein